MALETATFIGSLISTWPQGSDQRSTADDHFRLLKGVLLRTLPNLDGEVSLSAGEFNMLKSCCFNVQAQLNAMVDGSATGTVHYAMSAGNASLLGGYSAAQFARTDATVIFNAGIAVTQKDLGTLSGTLNIEPSSANYFGVVLAGNVGAVSIGAALTAGYTFSIRVQQDGAGNSTIAGWPVNVVWADGSAYGASSTASAIDFITMIYDGPLAVWLAAPRKYG